MGDVIRGDFSEIEGIYEEDGTEVEVVIRYPSGAEKQVTLLNCTISENRPVEIDPKTGDLMAEPHMLFLSGQVKPPGEKKES